MTAALVAEALAAAERETLEGFPEDETMYRVGYVNAALRHLAERVAKAEARSAKLRAAIVRVIDQRNKLSSVPYSIAIEALDEDNAAAKAALRGGELPALGEADAMFADGGA